MTSNKVSKIYIKQLKTIISSHYFAMATTVVTLLMFYPVLSGLGVITR